MGEKDHGSWIKIKNLNTVHLGLILLIMIFLVSHLALDLTQDTKLSFSIFSGTKYRERYYSELKYFFGMDCF